jgi:GTP pyrophosphokinase
MFSKLSIKELVRKEPSGLVAKAYKFAESAHKNQKRKTGEPYFIHPLATAEILSSWHLDEATIVAGLLHDTVEDTGTKIGTIAEEFGDQVAFLVNGVTKLGKIKYRGAEAEAKAENLRKMILAISEDLRVVFMKLADRLHNMRTLSALPPQKQRRIALETHEIYAPLAYRLGMQNLSGELQDLAFPYLYPEEYRWLKAQVTEAYEARIRYLEKLKPVVARALGDRGIHPTTIDFRAKRMSSLYKKLLRQGMDVEKIYDLVAMRLILKTQEACYGALGIIHELWPPLPGRIKDYIAMPKPNGYRSLHTTVIGPDKKILEFQIRTEEMHDEAEHGIAAHWIYKTHGGVSPVKQKRLLEEAKWVEQLKRWQERQSESGTNPDEFLESLKVDFFKDRIFVITPRGEVLDLPVGSTPVDFAYEIHSEIGSAAVGAKVNNQLVPLNHELHSGDFVEILVQKNKKPSEDWLTFVKTSNARDHIRLALRKKQTGLIKTAPGKSEIKITVKDRIGLIKDIAVIIARSHINIEGLTTIPVPGGDFQYIKAVCDTGDRQKIERLILKLKTIKEIREISYRLPPPQAV